MMRELYTDLITEPLTSKSSLSVRRFHTIVYFVPSCFAHSM